MKRQHELSEEQKGRSVWFPQSCLSRSNTRFFLETVRFRSATRPGAGKKPQHKTIQPVRVASAEMGWAVFFCFARRETLEIGRASCRERV